jgi:hypothetical protein
MMDEKFEVFTAVTMKNGVFLDVKHAAKKCQLGISSQRASVASYS